MLTEDWESSGLSAGRQLAGFQDVFDRTHSHWNLKAEGSQGYFAKVRRRQVDRFGLTSIICDPVGGIRDAHDAKSGKEGYFCLLYFDDGDCQLEQGHNEAVVQRDSIALWDSTRPARFRAKTRLIQHSLLIPHDLARTVNPRIENLCGTSLDGRQGTGAILLSHLRRIHRHIDQISAEQHKAILLSAVDLLSIMYRPSSDMRASTAFRQAIIGRVQDYIVVNLNRPDLSATTIAREFRFSPRYLHRLFGETDITVGEWIRKRRLLAARNDLENQFLRRGLSITEIAYSRGFSSSSHFSRVFREEFGMPPREYVKSIEKKTISGSH